MCITGSYLGKYLVINGTSPPTPQGVFEAHVDKGLGLQLRPPAMCLRRAGGGTQGAEFTVQKDAP